MSPVNTKLIPSKTHRITLYVNTDKLKYKKDTDKYEYVNFGQNPKISNKDYTLEIAMNDDIEWVGVSTSSPRVDIVFIKEIEFKKGEKILNKDILKGEKEIRGKVDKGKKGDQQFYSLYFEFLSKSNASNKRFKIDPILRII
jgi:hypothetical protein